MDSQKQSKASQDLAKTNFEYKQLQKEHETLEIQIDAISRKKYVTDEDEQRRRTLQKKKLIGRDRMEEILKRYQEQT